MIHRLCKNLTEVAPDYDLSRPSQVMVVMVLVMVMVVLLMVMVIIRTIVMCVKCDYDEVCNR